jgi:Apea-like HEPN
MLTIRLPDVIAVTYLQDWGSGGEENQIDNVITALRLYQEAYVGRGSINTWRTGIQRSFSFSNMTLDANIPEIADGGYSQPSYVLRKEDVTQITQLFNGIHNTSTGKQLGIALDRFNSSYRWTQGFQDQERIIDIVIALENIFGKDVLKQTTEIGYRLRMQAARYLGESIDERKTLQKFFSKLYALRSKIVHGNASNVADMVQKDFKKPLSEVVAEAEKYLRRALVKLLLNHSHMTQDYFNNLLLGEE